MVKTLGIPSRGIYPRWVNQRPVRRSQKTTAFRPSAMTTSKYRRRTGRPVHQPSSTRHSSRTVATGSPVQRSRRAGAVCPDAYAPGRAEDAGSGGAHDAMISNTRSPFNGAAHASENPYAGSMDERAGAARLAGAIADRLSAALPTGLEPRAEGDAVVLYAGDARSMVIPVRPFGDSGEAVEAVVDVLLAVRDEAEGHTRTRYETAAAVDGDVVRLWFGRLEPVTSEPPWRGVLPELPSLPLPPLLEDAGATTATFAGGCHPRPRPVRSGHGRSRDRATAQVGHARRQADARLPGRRVPRRVGHRARSPRPAQGAPAGQPAARVVSEVATV